MIIIFKKIIFEAESELVTSINPEQVSWTGYNTHANKYTTGTLDFIYLNNFRNCAWTGTYFQIYIIYQL